jgi:mono/diheme cytochrome c family protein
MKAFVASIAVASALCSVAASAQENRADRVAAGKQLYEAHCVACHGLGPGFPPFPELAGTSALRAKYGDQKPASLAERTDLTPELVAVFVRHGISIMPFYRKTELSDSELSSIGAYLSRNNPDLNRK